MDINEIVMLLQKQDISKQDLVALLSRVNKEDHDCSISTTTPSRYQMQSQFKLQSNIDTSKRKPKALTARSKVPNKEKKSCTLKPNINKQPFSPRRDSKYLKLYEDAQIMQIKKLEALNKKKMEDENKRSREYTFKPQINKFSLRRSSFDPKYSTCRNRSDTSIIKTPVINKTKRVTIDLLKPTYCANEEFIKRQNIFLAKKKKDICNMSNDLNRTEALLFNTRSEPKNRCNYSQTYKRALCHTPMPNANAAYSGMYDKIGFNLEKVEMTKNTKRSNTLQKAQEAIKQLQCSLNY